jgi:hypothetical protein
VSRTVIDDHLLRDVLVGRRPSDLDGVASEGIATTGLWLFRLCSAWAKPTIVGRLSAPVAGLSDELQARFRSQLVALPPEVEVLTMRELAWSMAELRTRHRDDGRNLSAAMVEALAAAHRLGGAIAVSRHDIGPNLRAAAEADDIAFRAL